MSHSQVVLGIAADDASKNNVANRTITRPNDATIQIDVMYLSKESQLWPENFCATKRRLIAGIYGRGRLIAKAIVAPIILLVPSSYAILIATSIFGGCCTNVCARV